MIENPYWFDFDSTEPLFSQHHGENHKHRKRAKRNHRNRKLRPSRHSVNKRSVNKYRDDQDDLPDEVFIASEVIGNIFNENDTIPGL
jgi:hypothetical protein